MSLTLNLDYSRKIIVEPGFGRFITTRELAERGQAADDLARQRIFRDEATKTLMLRPLQLDPSFLNTVAQLDSILRGSDLVFNPADLASRAIFEAPAFGNNDNPFYFHTPVGPSPAFPSAVAPAFPGSAPSIAGVDTPVAAIGTDGLVRINPEILQPSLTIMPPPPPSAVPAVTPIGGTADGKFITHSATRMPANQALYFRWFHPPSAVGFRCTYEFYVGQYKLRITDDVVEVFRDTSSGGDRSAWQLEMLAPLFSTGQFSPTGPGSLMGVISAAERLAHDRSLLWLPYRRNQIYLHSSEGKWAILDANSRAKRLADNSAWDITREDTVMVWVLTPAAGRFQIQKVKYPGGFSKVQSPTLMMDYTPSTPPAIALVKDSDHGSTITSTRTQPPAYAIQENSASDCPPVTSTGATDIRRVYGVELTFQASSDQRWTPFFYGFQAGVAAVLGNSPGTPTTVPDTRLASAKLTAGLTPGSGRLTAEVWDFTPFPLSGFYYRSGLPMQVVETVGPSIYFAGIGEPTEVTPLKETDTPRRITFSALDRWKLLAQTFLRDQRDWTGFGHIDVVAFTCQQAGIDVTGAEFPAGYVPGVISTTNSAIGGTEPTINQQAQDVEQGWRPRAEDTAATYIQRIADYYSGWYVGFRLDGTFFYLPRTYYSTPSGTFAAEHTGGAPFFYGSPTFTTEEPEANVIVVACGSAQSGGIQTSSPWVDHASIVNPAVVNYLGRWKAELVQVGGTFTCPQLNWMARRIWEQTRRRRRNVSFEADFVPSLKIGQVCTLGPYGNYRITGVSVDLAHEGHHRAQYEGEFLELGYGLP